MRVWILGESGVGKSRWIARLCSRQYDETETSLMSVYPSEMGVSWVDISTRASEVMGSAAVRLIEMELRPEDVVLLMFRVDRRWTFTKLVEWEVIPFVYYRIAGVIGNAVDGAVGAREVSVLEAAAYAAERGWRYIEASAREGVGGDAMETLVRRVAESRNRWSPLYASPTGSPQYATPTGGAGYVALGAEDDSSDEEKKGKRGWCRRRKCC